MWMWLHNTPPTCSYQSPIIEYHSVLFQPSLCCLIPNTYYSLVLLALHAGHSLKYIIIFRRPLAIESSRTQSYANPKQSLSSFIEAKTIVVRIRALSMHSPCPIHFSPHSLVWGANAWICHLAVALILVLSLIAKGRFHGRASDGDIPFTYQVWPT